MVDATHTAYDASDRSYYAIIKKEVHHLGSSIGLPERRLAELDIIIAEMTSNLHKYATGGELLLGHFKYADKEYIEIISIDSGPGMADVVRMMGDGYSTTNTMGHGLGSIKRLSDQFDIYSQKGWGTIVLSRVFKSAPPKSKRRTEAVQIGAVVVAKPGETTSGDGYYMKITDRHIKMILADGLGHGPEANLAVNEAIRVFKTCPYMSPVEIIRYLHPSVRKTRGLVATVAVIDLAQKQLNIAGVGNISGKLIGNVMSKSHLAYNGIIGHNIPNTMNDQAISLTDYNQLILCSDGIRSRWDAGKLPGINRCDQTIAAAAIYKDFARRTDDMSAVVAKFN